jgi:hypothetical protein
MTHSTRDAPAYFATPDAAAERRQVVRDDVLRLARKAIALVLPLSIVPIVCVTGDAGHVYHAKRYAEAVAVALASGKNVTGAGEFDQRYFESAFVRNLHNKPELLVLGSSRAMILSSRLLARPLVNSAVSGASMNDLFAIYELYRERKLVPRTILLCIDPWTMNENDPDRRWRSLETQANALRSRLGLATSPGGLRESIAGLREKLTGGLLSPQYFRESLRSLLRGRTAVASLHQTDVQLNTDATRLPDGSVTWDQQFREHTVADAMLDAHRYVAADPVYGLAGFAAVTMNQREAFRRLLDAMRNDGVDVRIALFPYHPAVYAALSTSRRYVSPDSVEHVIREIAREAAVPVAGSFSPKILGLGSNDFYDAMHPHDAPSRAIALLALR